MSTKIYDAWRWKGDVNVIIDRLKVTREKLWDAAVLTIDSVTSYQGTPNRMFKESVQLKHSEITELVRKGIEEGEWGNELSLGCSAVMYFLRGYSGVVFQVFGLRPKEIKECVNTRGCIDWHWQNQTDRPTRLSLPEWNERGKFWGRIYKDISVPSKAGLVFPIIEADDARRLAHAVIDLRMDRARKERENAEAKKQLGL